VTKLNKNYSVKVFDLLNNIHRSSGAILGCLAIVGGITKYQLQPLLRRYAYLSTGNCRSQSLVNDLQ